MGNPVDFQPPWPSAPCRPTIVGYVWVRLPSSLRPFWPLPSHHFVNKGTAFPSIMNCKICQNPHWQIHHSDFFDQKVSQKNRPWLQWLAKCPEKISTHGRQLGFQINMQRIKIPSGKRLHNYGKSPCYSWENSLFLWPCSMSLSMYVYQAGYLKLAKAVTVFSGQCGKNLVSWVLIGLKKLAEYWICENVQSVNFLPAFRLSAGQNVVCLTVFDWEKAHNVTMWHHWWCFPIYSRSFRCVKPSFRRFSMLCSPHAKNIR